MRVERVDATNEELSDAEGARWSQVSADEIVLSPVPLAMQPTEYIRISRSGRPYGGASSMEVSALHNGKSIFFHLGWKDESEDGAINDINQFVDAAAVIFPVNGDAPLFGMGTPDKPVNMWYWRADWERPRNVAAEGMGTTQRRADPALTSSARHATGRWDVVICRSFGTEGTLPGTVTLAPGDATKVAFAIWQGSNVERAGIKAFSPSWQELELDA